jgi:acyl-CoA synthetase (NDP forming)
MGSAVGNALLCGGARVVATVQGRSERTIALARRAELELLPDVAFRLTPVTDVDAKEMISGLRSSPLFDGYRGALPRDKDALIDLVRRVSAIVEIAPELAELDLNPVKVLQPGSGAVVVDARALLR